MKRDNTTIIEAILGLAMLVLVVLIYVVAGGSDDFLRQLSP